MKKKFICITTMLCICLSVGCGNQNATENNSDKKAENDSSTEKSNTNSAQSSTSTTATDFYATASSLPAQEVDAYAANIRSLILAHDWDSLADELCYPAFVNGTTYEDRNAFLALDIDNNISQTFLDSIESETCQEMFCNCEGISMGSAGEIWFNEIINDNGSSELKITGINGIVK